MASRFPILGILTLSVSWAPLLFAGPSQARVYFEPACLSLFSNAFKPEDLLRDGEKNETVVNQDELNIRVNRTLVVEKREGEVEEAYIRIDCQSAGSSQ